MSGTIQINDYRPEAFTTFDGSEVVVTPHLVLFWKPPCAFGQWTASPFDVDGVGYNCAEQFMMAEKARLFGDIAMHNRILAATSPREQQKKLGKLVSGYVEEEWVQRRRQIVLRGNIAKFSQNAALCNELLGTQERRLAEASPVDRIWGIGLAADNPDAYDPRNWKGLNLLGKVLEDVRDHLEREQRSA